MLALRGHSFVDSFCDLQTILEMPKRYEKNTRWRGAVVSSLNIGYHDMFFVCLKA